jgi:hypothetical protein
MSLEHFTALTNVFLTVGLLIFAAMQWWVTHSAEKTRVTERAEDATAARHAEELDQYRAYQTVWAEHFRLDSLADSWQNEDLVMLSALKILRSSDLLPRDWSQIVSSLGVLGREAGFLGAVAITAAHDAEREVAALNALVASFDKQFPQASPSTLSALVRKNEPRESDRLEATIRRLVRDLSMLLWDATVQSPRATVTRDLNFTDNLRSEFARGAVNELLRRGAEGSYGGQAGQPAGDDEAH